MLKLMSCFEIRLTVSWLLVFSVSSVQKRELGLKGHFLYLCHMGFATSSPQETRDMSADFVPLSLKWILDSYLLNILTQKWHFSGKQVRRKLTWDLLSLNMIYNNLTKTTFWTITGNCFHPYTPGVRRWCRLMRRKVFHVFGAACNA